MFILRLEFPDNYFYIICISKSLYFIYNPKKLHSLFLDMDRVLRNSGKILLFEPYKVNETGRSQNEAKKIFENLDYETEIIDVHVSNNWIKRSIVICNKI